MRLTEITKRRLQAGDYGLVVIFSSNNPKFNSFDIVKDTLEQFGGLNTNKISPDTHLLVFPEVEQAEQARRFIRRRSRGEPQFSVSFRLYVWDSAGYHWVSVQV